MSLAAFIIALLLLAGTVDPTRGWLIALTVVAGIAALRPRLWILPFDLRPAIDARLATFVIAVLLLAGTVDATRDWLIALSVVAGFGAFMPRLLSPWRLRGRRAWRARRGDFTLDADDEREDRRWQRWERRLDRELRRSGVHWGDEPR
jgi:hypothetical protein